MKLAALIVQLDGKNGGLHSIPGNSVGPLVDLAKQVRVSGEIDVGGKKPAKVLGGVVLSDWTLGPVMKFKCAQKAAE